MKKLIVCGAIALSSFAAAYGQKVYSTDRQYQADVKVYVVNAEYKADLVVYRTDRSYTQGIRDNKGIWHFVDHEYQADRKIYFVDHEYQADLKVFFTDKEYRAGWKTNSKRHLMY